MIGGRYFRIENKNPDVPPNRMLLDVYVSPKPTEHLSSPPAFSGVRVTRYLVLCLCFVDRCSTSKDKLIPYCEKQKSCSVTADRNVFNDSTCPASITEKFQATWFCVNSMYILT
jgi:hypothetical protein